MVQQLELEVGHELAERRAHRPRAITGEAQRARRDDLRIEHSAREVEAREQRMARGRLFRDLRHALAQTLRTFERDDRRRELSEQRHVRADALAQPLLPGAGPTAIGVSFASERPS
jgi:hypothetical protein